MKVLKSLLVIHLTLIATAAQQKEVPREWVDPDTGHRVIRLSEEPGSQSLYFHQNGYTPDGSKMIITTPTGLSVVNLRTRAVEKVVEGRVSVIIVGRKTGQVYYTKVTREGGRFSAAVYATDLDTKATREVVKLPPGVNVSSVNADETLLAGTLDEKLAKDASRAAPAAARRPRRRRREESVRAVRRPRASRRKSSARARMLTPARAR